MRSSKNGMRIWTSWKRRVNTAPDDPDCVFRSGSRRSARDHRWLTRATTVYAYLTESRAYDVGELRRPPTRESASGEQFVLGFMLFRAPGFERDSFFFKSRYRAPALPEAITADTPRPSPRCGTDAEGDRRTVQGSGSPIEGPTRSIAGR